jgi:hypothetical protein
MNRINLGDRVRDIITNLEGIAIARTEWMYGCRRVTVQPQEAKDGKPADSFTVDEPQLDLLEVGAFQPIAPTVSMNPPVATATNPTLVSGDSRKHGNRPDVGARPSTPSRH